MTDVPSFEEPHFLPAMMSVSNSLLTSGYAVRFWFDIDAIYTARLEAIKRAQKTIHFETFYMTPGQRADDFATALMERSLAGVEVLFIADSLGVSSISQDYWQKLKAAGVGVRFFHEFNWQAPLNYNIRTHRKLLLIDGEVAFVGGTGVSDHWDGIMPKDIIPPWLDLEVCLTGEVVVILEGIFMQHWLYEGGVASLRAELFKPAVTGEFNMLVTPGSSPSASSSVCALFYTTFLAAKKRIWIASPYFLLDSNSRRALLEAKKRGVEIRILTMGTKNDKTLVYYAVRQGYADLLTAGIEIYEYQPSMMHAKVLLIDDTFVSTGSANLDPRSMFHNDELNISLAEPKLANFVETFFVYGFSKSRQIKMSEWKRRNILQKLLGQLVLSFRWQL
ncbi:phospholipase D-like domain-containing protein [Anabaena sphaerica]|nr:phospholipase D-like domain-containing protein [Anabaena sphaerica]